MCGLQQDEPQPRPALPWAFYKSNLLQMTDPLRGDEVLGAVDPRDVIYTKTRLWTLSADQSSRRHPHRKKCTLTGNSSINRHPGTCSTFTRGPSVFSNHTKVAEGHLGSRRPLRVLPLTFIHRRLRLEWCHARENWTAVEWNQVVFNDVCESRFNLSSDDNCVRVWRPCGERLNPAFALQ
ncbi:uncharacterized protein TNCV_5134361 [Trichonephila clavipes]|nr:uncharacterized protein TNCV_5134361 [Trichonephila clavipes]